MKKIFLLTSFTLFFSFFIFEKSFAYDGTLTLTPIPLRVENYGDFVAVSNTECVSDSSISLWEHTDRYGVQAIGGLSQCPSVNTGETYSIEAGQQAHGFVYLSACADLMNTPTWPIQTDPGCSDWQSFEYGTTPPSEVCGDSSIDGDEECDDGDTSSGDGCSNLCLVETDFNCVGEPSVCTLLGGDGSNGFPAMQPSQVSSFTTKLGNSLSQLVDFFVSGAGLFFTLSVGLIILMYLIRWARFGSIDSVGVSDLSERIKNPSYQSKI